MPDPLSITVAGAGIGGLTAALCLSDAGHAVTLVERRTGFSEVGADRVTAVTGLARDWEVSVLLKGRITLISDPAGRVYGNDAGSSWAATAAR